MSYNSKSCSTAQGLLLNFHSQDLWLSQTQWKFKGKEEENKGQFRRINVCVHREELTNPFATLAYQILQTIYSPA